MIGLLLACKGTLPVATIVVNDTPVTVEVAASYESRQRGLMHRDGLPTDHGMLFVYADQAPRSFWMKDTRMPLSIAFADRSGKIVRIADMQPFDLGTTQSLYPATYALEMEQGWFVAHGVEAGGALRSLPEVDPE